MCLCDMPDLKAFAKRIIATLKVFMKKGNALKPMLEQAGGVMRLVAASAHGHVTETWHHISYVNQNSWDIALMEMCIDTDAVNKATALAIGNVALTACGGGPAGSGGDPWEALRINHLYKALSKIPLDHGVSFTLFEIVGGDQPIWPSA